MSVTVRAPGAARAPEAVRGSGAERPVPRELLTWIRVQSDNTCRHLVALRPFRAGEFGEGPEAPTQGHLETANELIEQLRDRLRHRSDALAKAVTAATNVPSSGNLSRLLRLKEEAHDAVRAVEQIWDFYFELFGQRQSPFGPWLLACDRIALDCYQHAYLGLAVARSIPAPPAFCYVRTGFSPATFRRGVPLRRLGRRLNPFPLIQLPYHRLVNPWTLGAILHEVSHNLQNDLGLARAVPAEIARGLLRAGVPPAVVAVWIGWQRETFADLCGVLLGGPAVVESLFDIVGRGRRTVVSYVPGAPHPTPYLRAYLSTELLRRTGFAADARRYERIWSSHYPSPRAGTIPSPVLETFPLARRVVVRAVAETAYPSLGGQTLTATLRFRPKEQHMVEEAARRLATGNDPGVVPERFLIGAARFALDRRLASPDTITTHFYRQLAGR